MEFVNAVEHVRGGVTQILTAIAVHKIDTRHI